MIKINFVKKFIEIILIIIIFNYQFTNLKGDLTSTPDLNFINSKGFGPALPPPPSPEEIEKIMQSPEFKKMMEELEDIFGEIEKEDLEKTKPIPKEKPSEEQKQPITPKEKAFQKLSKEKEFTQPIKKEADNIVQKLSNDKLSAFNYFTNQFLNELETLESKINSFSIGIAFKEKLEKKDIFTTILKIKIYLNLINSKKIYIKAFYLPTFTSLRKIIIKKIIELKQINKEIKQNEEKETIEFLKAKASSLVNNETNKVIMSPLQKKIQILLTRDIKTIKTELENITKHTQVKIKIEKKKKIREENIKKTEQNITRQNNYSSRFPYSSKEDNLNWAAPYSGGYPISYPRSYSRDKRTKLPSRSSYGQKPSTNPIASKNKISSKAKKASSPKQKISIIGNEKKTPKTKILELNKENLKNINSIITTYKKEDKTSHRKILTTDLLKNISKNIEQTKKLENKLTEKIKQTIKTSLPNNIIKQFIPILENLITYKVSNDDKEKEKIEKELKYAEKILKYFKPKSKTKLS